MLMPAGVVLIFGALVVLNLARFKMLLNNGLSVCTGALAAVVNLPRRKGRMDGLPRNLGLEVVVGVVDVVAVSLVAVADVLEDVFGTNHQGELAILEGNLSVADLGATHNIL